MLSIVCPCHNEVDNLRLLHQRICEALDPLGIRLELILVDDGSSDGTAWLIHQLAQQDGRVRGLILSRNFGHQAALTAGYAHARGDPVAVLDADLQHPPELLPTMLKAWQAGADIVHAQRTGADGSPIPPRLGYRLWNRLASVAIPCEVADFRLMSRAAVDALLSMPERRRFLRGMVAWIGFAQACVPYQQDARHAGRPAYSIARRIALRIDSLLGFSAVPLRLAGWLGAITLALGLAYAGWILITLAVAGREAAGIQSGWPALILTVLLLGGVQLLCLGVMAEYIGCVYDEVKQRPLYLVRERINLAESSDGPELPSARPPDQHAPPNAPDPGQNP